MNAHFSEFHRIAASVVTMLLLSLGANPLKCQILSCLEQEQIHIVSIHLSVSQNALTTLASSSNFAEAIVSGECGASNEVFVKFDGSIRPNPADLVPGMTLDVPCCATCSNQHCVTIRLQRSADDLAGLSRYFAAQIATAMLVHGAVYNHARVSLNNQDLGIYVCITEPPSLRRHRAPLANIVDLRKVDQALPDSLAQLVTDSEAKHLHVAPEVYERVFDTQMLTKLVAYEMLIRNLNGFTETDANAVIAKGNDGRITAICPELMEMVFINPLMPLLLRPKGAAAARFIENPDTLQVVLNTVSQIVNNPQTMSELWVKLNDRATLIRNSLSRKSDLITFDRQYTILRRRIKERIEKVSFEINHLSSAPRLSLKTYTRSHRLMNVTSASKATEAVPAATASPCLSAFRAVLNSTEFHGSEQKPKFLEIRIVSPDVDKMTINSTNWVFVSLYSNGIEYSNVALRLKGHITRATFQSKPSFTLNFKYATPSQEWNGQPKVHINNCLYDSTMLNEFFGAWLCKQSGIPSPEVNYAKVYVNGKDYGLFTAVEGATKTFLAKSFSENDGLLFEGEFRDIDNGLDVDSGKVPDGYSGLRDLRTAASVAMVNRSYTPLTSFCDLEYLSRYAAVEVVLGHTDGYCLGANNYRIYQSSQSGLFWLIPHGMDTLALGSIPELYPRMHGIVAKALMSAPEARVEYIKAVASVLSENMNLLEWARLAGSITSLIQENVLQDPIYARKQLLAAEQMLLTLERRITRMRTRISESADQEWAGF